MWEHIFDFGHMPTLVGYTGADFEEGCKFITNVPIFHKIDPLKSDSKNFLCYATFL